MSKHFTKKNLSIALAVLLFFSLTSTCNSCNVKNTQNKQAIEFKEYQEKTNKSIDSLGNLISKQVTLEEVRDQMDQSMYNFLIFEYDLDRGKISLSDIKNKINE